MDQFDTRFEIIEDDAPKPKRKRKRKDRISLNYVPWRLVAICLMAGMTVGIVLIFVLTRSVTQEVMSKPPTVIESSDVTSGNPIVRGNIQDIAFSDSDMISLSSANVQIYKDSKLAQVLDTGGNVVFSPDGKRLASFSVKNELSNGAKRVLQLWDTATGTLLKEDVVGTIDGPSIPSKNLAFSPSNVLVAAGIQGGIIVWDVETLERRAEIPQQLTGVVAIAFSADGNRLSAVIEQDNWYENKQTAMVKVWDIRNPHDPRVFYTLPLYFPFSRTATLSADGHYLAYTINMGTNSAVQEEIRIYDLLERRRVGVIPFEEGVHIGALAITDKTLVFTARNQGQGGDENSMRVLKWSFEVGQFSTELIAGPQSLRTLGVSHLHLWTADDHTGVDYFALDTYTLMRWDFTTNTIKPLPI